MSKYIKHAIFPQTREYAKINMSYKTRFSGSGPDSDRSGVSEAHTLPIRICKYVKPGP